VGVWAGVLVTLVSTSSNAFKLLTLANPDKTKEFLLTRVVGTLSHFESELKIFWTKSRLKSIICSYIYMIDISFGGMVSSPISPKPKSEKENGEKNYGPQKKLVHVKKNYTHARQQMHVNFSTPSPTKLSISNICSHPKQHPCWAKRSHQHFNPPRRDPSNHIQNPHHPMHDEQINKPMD
jgi:hypothetical protein